MGGKAKPKKHTAAELAAKAKAATESVGGGKAGIAERDTKSNMKNECLEPGCQGVKLASLTVCKTHWGTKHCDCRQVECKCFPTEKYEALFAKPTARVATHHNQVCHSGHRARRCEMCGIVVGWVDAREGGGWTGVVAGLGWGGLVVDWVDAHPSRHRCLARCITRTVGPRRM